MHIYKEKWAKWLEYGILNTTSYSINSSSFFDLEIFSTHSFAVCTIISTLHYSLWDFPPSHRRPFLQKLVIAWSHQIQRRLSDNSQNSYFFLRLSFSSLLTQILKSCSYPVILPKCQPNSKLWVQKQRQLCQDFYLANIDYKRPLIVRCQKC